jgi:hypothetical protein
VLQCCLFYWFRVNVCRWITKFNCLVNVVIVCFIWNCNGFFFRGLICEEFLEFLLKFLTVFFCFNYAAKSRIKIAELAKSRITKYRKIVSTSNVCGTRIFKIHRLFFLRPIDRNYINDLLQFPPA